MIKLTNYSSNPNVAEINFKKLENNFIYDEVITAGLITKELYYTDEAKTDLVVEVLVAYEYGSDTLVRKMNYTINYFNEDNTIGLIVPKTKILTTRQKLSLLKKRRKTVRQSAEATVLGLLQLVLTDKTITEIMTIGAGFLLTNDTSLDHYEKVGSPQIIIDLQVATDTWLDTTPVQLGGATIRQYLIGAFSA